MANVMVARNTYTTDKLYQWDLNQELKIYGLSVPITPEIHFAHESMNEAIVRTATMDSAGVISVKIPNSLLEKPNKINAYVCITENGTFQSLYKIVIPVIGRAKPSDYEMTDPEGEIYSISALAAEVVTLEAGSEATVHKTVADGMVKLTFGIPRGLPGKDGKDGLDGKDGDKGDKGDPGEAVGTFYITVTESNGKYTADKTVAEIETAYQAGYVLYCVVPYGGDKCVIPMTCRTTAAFWTFEGLVFGEIIRVQFMGDSIIDYTKVAVGGGGGGVTSWNDLTDKPFGEEEVYIVPETETVFAPNEDMGGLYMAVLSTSGVRPIVNNTYIVRFGNVEYECVCGAMGAGFSIGNMGIMGGEDTGEPFALAIEGEMAMVISASEISTISVSVRGNHIKKLDDAYVSYEAGLVDLVSYGLPTVNNEQTVSTGSSTDVIYALESAMRMGIVKLRLKITASVPNPLNNMLYTEYSDAEFEVYANVGHIETDTDGNIIAYNLYAVVGGAIIYVSISYASIQGRVYYISLNTAVT